MAPKHRPRPYTTLDRDYLAQDTIRDLGEQFGPVGPLVFLALILNAGKAITEGAEVGTVELRWRSFAREAFTDADTARAILETSVALGLVDDLADIGRGRFSARLVKAERWESRPMSNAERQARHRSKRNESNEDPLQ